VLRPEGGGGSRFDGGGGDKKHKQQNRGHGWRRAVVRGVSGGGVATYSAAPRYLYLFFEIL
jgi:hypothetical protein